MSCKRVNRLQEISPNSVNPNSKTKIFNNLKQHTKTPYNKTKQQEKAIGTATALGLFQMARRQTKKITSPGNVQQ